MFLTASFHSKENQLFTHYYRPMAVGIMIIAGTLCRTQLREIGSSQIEPTTFKM